MANLKELKSELNTYILPRHGHHKDHQRLFFQSDPQMDPPKSRVLADAAKTETARSTTQEVR